jgi:WD40 repeat protein
VVGSSGVLDSGPVLREISLFTSSGRKVIPVAFGDSLDPGKIHGFAIERFLSEAILRIKEDDALLSTGPSNAALDELQRAFRAVRQSTKRIRALQVVSIVLCLLVVGTTGLAWFAQRERTIAESALFVSQAERYRNANRKLSLEYAIDAMRDSPTEDAEVALNSALTAAPIHAVLQHSNEVWAAIFSPDSKRVLTSSEDGIAQLWDVATGIRLMILSGHRFNVFGVAFSPDGKSVVTSSADKTARLWDAAGGACWSVSLATTAS